MTADPPRTDANPAWKVLGSGGGARVDTPYEAGEGRPEIDCVVLNPPQRLLDIGCADGMVSKRLRQKYPGLFCWGVEISQAADEAEKHLDRVTRCSLTEAGEAEIQLLPTMVTVLLLDVLEHMYDPWGTLCFLARHLAPTAQLIISLPNIGYAAVLQDLANGYWQYQLTGLLDVTHIRFFTLFEMEKMFYETGFRIVERAFVVNYCVDKHKYPPNAFPAQVDFGGVQLIVQSHEQFVCLNSQQILFNIQRAEDAVLSPAELALRHSSHPKTRV